MLVQLSLHGLLNLSRPWSNSMATLSKSSVVACLTEVLNCTGTAFGKVTDLHLLHLALVINLPWRGSVSLQRVPSA